MKAVIQRARPEDAGQLAAVFNASFYSDYLRYGECPGYNKTEEGMRAGIAEHLVYTIALGGKTVGAISVRELHEGHFHLGALCVIPEFAGRGIGQQAMYFLDAEFPQAAHWALETPSDKQQNHYFYEKFGYRVTREYMDGAVRVSLLERTRPA